MLYDTDKLTKSAYREEGIFFNTLKVLSSGKSEYLVKIIREQISPAGESRAHKYFMGESAILNFAERVI